jgi:hypothetical protein
VPYAVQNTVDSILNIKEKATLWSIYLYFCNSTNLHSTICGSHNIKYENGCLLGCSTMWSCRSLPFQRYLLTSLSGQWVSMQGVSLRYRNQSVKAQPWPDLQGIKWQSHKGKGTNRTLGAHYSLVRRRGKDTPSLSCSFPPYWPGCSMPLPLCNPTFIPYRSVQGSALMDWFLYLKMPHHMHLSHWPDDGGS